MRLPIWHALDQAFTANLALAAALLPTAAVARVEVDAEQAERPPNILLIVIDDLGYGELSCQGNPEIPTPHIDSLAQNGIRFTQGYVSAPYCAPSRAGFLTGRYQSRFGYEFNPVGPRNLDPNLGLPLSEMTLADYLREAGYATGLVGKWHLGATVQHHPTKRGFDEFFGFLHEGHFYAPAGRPGLTTFLRTNQLPVTGAIRWTNGPVVWSSHMRHNEPHYDENNPMLRGTDPIAESQFLTTAWAREGSAFIRRHQAEPWFLLLAHNAPHSPMQATEVWLERFAHLQDLHRRMFAGMVAHLDHSIGSVLDTVRSLDLEANTLIFLFSDNGGPTRELTSSNAPLRGGKGRLWEGGIRVPFLVQWKSRLPTDRVYEHPVISLDVLPTALAAVGQPIPDGLDGVNLLPFLKGDMSQAPHDTLFWRYGRQAALRSGDWKYVTGIERSDDPPRLYQLADDPGEQHDLARTHPARLAEMQAAWDRIANTLPPPTKPSR